jgi:ParB/RepB/Spo0J family partition protein
MMTDTGQTPEVVVHLPIDALTPSPHQSRRRFDAAALEDLARSLAAQGLLQPILVRPMGNGAYHIVGGERRWRAAKSLGWATIACLVREMTDEQEAEQVMVDNVIRADLSPLEEAAACGGLVDMGYTAVRISKRVGRCVSVVNNRLSLLKLTPGARAALEEGRLRLRSAEALSRLHVAMQDAALLLLGRGDRDEKGIPDLCQRLRRLEDDTFWLHAPRSRELTPRERNDSRMAQVVRKRALEDPEAIAALMTRGGGGVYGLPGWPETPEAMWHHVAKAGRHTCARCQLRGSGEAPTGHPCYPCATTQCSADDTCMLYVGPGDPYLVLLFREPQDPAAAALVRHVNAEVWTGSESLAVQMARHWRGENMPAVARCSNRIESLADEWLIYYLLQQESMSLGNHMLAQLCRHCRHWKDDAGALALLQASGCCAVVAGEVRRPDGKAYDTLGTGGLSVRDGAGNCAIPRCKHFERADLRALPRLDDADRRRLARWVLESYGHDSSCPSGKEGSEEPDDGQVVYLVALELLQSHLAGKPEATIFNPIAGRDERLQYRTLAQLKGHSSQRVERISGRTAGDRRERRKEAPA